MELKKYPIYINGEDYTAVVSENSIGFYDVNLYRGSKAYSWKWVYCKSIGRYQTPVEAVKITAKMYKNDMELKRKKEEKRQKDIEEFELWDGKIDDE
jgi:hypothetical protein